jgi:copper(I)-binding protein
MSIRVQAAIVPQPASTDEAALYLVLHNEGTVDDTLTAVWSELAQKGEMHETMAMSGGMSHMAPVARVVVKAGGDLRFAPGGTHVMLTQLSRKPAVGESVPVRLRFAVAGDLSIAADVVAYADLEARLGKP